MSSSSAAMLNRAVRLDFESFVDENAPAFVGFGVDRVRRSPVARIVHAMCFDVCDDPVTAELQAVSKISMVMIEIDRQLSPSQDYLSCPAERLAPLHIDGAGSYQRRWIDALNLRQLRGWHQKGYGDYSFEITDLTESVNASFEAESIGVLDLLNEREPGWIG